MRPFSRMNALCQRILRSIPTLPFWASPRVLHYAWCELRGAKTLRIPKHMVYPGALQLFRELDRTEKASGSRFTGRQECETCRAPQADPFWGLRSKLTSITLLGIIIEVENHLFVEEHGQSWSSKTIFIHFPFPCMMVPESVNPTPRRNKSRKRAACVKIIILCHCLSQLQFFHEELRPPSLPSVPIS